MPAEENVPALQTDDAYTSCALVCTNFLTDSVYKLTCVAHTLARRGGYQVRLRASGLGRWRTGRGGLFYLGHALKGLLAWGGRCG